MMWCMDDPEERPCGSQDDSEDDYGRPSQLIRRGDVSGLAARMARDPEPCRGSTLNGLLSHERAELDRLLAARGLSLDEEDGWLYVQART
jgi:hypothetical protein